MKNQSTDRKMNKSIIKSYLFIIALVSFVVACSEHDNSTLYQASVGVAVAPSAIPGNSSGNAGPTTAVSGGPNETGVTAATAAGVVGRLQNALEGNASSSSGNFAKGLAQVSSNLPHVANVNLTTGFDQVELLAYAACSDLTTGGTPAMQSVYNVQVNSTIAQNQAALVAAGLRMLDMHTAGIASQGPSSAAVAAALTSLVTTEAGVATNTSTIAFMAVCIAANTAGAAMLGL